MAGGLSAAAILAAYRTTGAVQTLAETNPGLLLGSFYLWGFIIAAVIIIIICIRFRRFLKAVYCLFRGKTKQEKSQKSWFFQMIFSFLDTKCLMGCGKILHKTNKILIKVDLRVRFYCSGIVSNRKCDILWKIYSLMWKEFYYENGALSESLERIYNLDRD